jgi:predicted alpha-1,6-mannanase (GH76 family)
LDKKQSDLEWAMKIYSWLKENLYEPGNGFVYDGTNRLKNGQKDNWRFTYNQGVFIGAAVELFKITGDKSFLNDAIKAADYTLNNNINGNDRILQDEGDGDGGLFKGIFIRYFTQLILLPDLDLASRKRYVIFLKHNAETLWNEGTNKNPVLFGTYWKTKPSAKTGLSQQLSGNMLMEAMDLLARNKML